MKSGELSKHEKDIYVISRQIVDKTTTNNTKAAKWIASQIQLQIDKDSLLIKKRK